MERMSALTVGGQARAFSFPPFVLLTLGLQLGWRSSPQLMQKIKVLELVVFASRFRTGVASTSCPDSLLMWDQSLAAYVGETAYKQSFITACCWLLRVVIVTMVMSVGAWETSRFLWFPGAPSGASSPHSSVSHRLHRTDFRNLCATRVLVQVMNALREEDTSFC